MPSVKRQYLQRLSGAGCLGLFALVLAAVAIPACDSGPTIVNLMPAPAVFEDGAISRESFGSAALEGMLRIPERLVVYVSSEDSALVWSRRILRRYRIGEMWSETPAPGIMDFMRTNQSLEFIDVTDAAGSTSGNGHGYFRTSPWVSSDVLTLLAFNLDPAQRGLEKKADGLIWTFPPDYIEGLRKALREFRPELALADGDAAGSR